MPAGFRPIPEQELTAFGRKSFAHLEDYPEAKAFWWPRFLRIARWFAGWERERRPQLASVHGEIRGELKMPLGAATFVLSARADRIERREDGTYTILDYKTGQPPTAPQVQAGLAPQLTLEAAILKGGGFAEKGVPAGSVADLYYVRLKGGEPPGEPKRIKFDDSIPTNRPSARGQSSPVSPPSSSSTASPIARWCIRCGQKHYGDYDHLARVKEWAASGGESEVDIPGSQS